MTFISLPTRRQSIVAGLACCLPLTSGAADNPATLRGIVDAAIRPLMAEHKVPGMAVAVTVDGQAFFYNYGVASEEKNTPVSEATLFELGSVSKVFTATLASYAQVLGKLSLRDHPGKYMPELKSHAIDKVNLLNLGTYTVGMPLQFPDEIEDGQMVGYFQQWQPAAAPGTQRQYSNPSLGLFGHLTALALKSDFADVMESQLLPGLGLKRTYVRVPETAMADYAWGYNKANQAVRMNPGVFAAQTYGIRSNAADMIHFVQTNLDPRLLNDNMRRAVQGTQVGYFKIGNMTQGLGWEQYAHPITLKGLLAGNSKEMIFDANTAKGIAAPKPSTRATWFNKTGSTNGFGSYVAFVPQHKIGIVMLANKNFPIPARVTAAHSILGQLAPSAK